MSSSARCAGLAVLALFAGGWLAGEAQAQSGCQVWLVQAESGYRVGDFDRVLDPETPCLERGAGVTKRERVQYYRLLAITHLALDREAEAREAVDELLRRSPEFEPLLDDPVRFQRMVAEARRSAVQVASVSKTKESLREAPATVVVVTAEEIRRRGYVDLEQVFHDLPGFDISRGNGDVYSNLYQRGFRSNTTDRTLFLVDGVEQNDLHSNIAYISRQYALSSIDRIEVVYGPASTMYGANAYTGVISVLTKQPEAMVREGRRWGIEAEIGGGSFGTRFAEFSLAGTLPESRLSWSLSGRSYRSDEMDLSRYPEWDGVVDLPDLETYRRLLAVEGFPLSDEDLERARGLDSRLLASLADRSFRFADETDDWSLSGKLRFSNLTVGLQMWRRQEGSAPWYTDALRTGNGNALTPRQTALYVGYKRSVGDVSFSVLTRYKEHELDGDSPVSRLALYANRFYDDFDLGECDATTCVDILDEFPAELPYFERLELDQVSTQLRTEATVVYEPSDRFSLVAGAEVRSSSIQADFISRRDELFFNPDDLFEQCFGEGEDEFCISEPPAGFVVERSRLELGTRDLGLYSQLSFKPWRNLRVVVGARVDENELRSVPSAQDLYGGLDLLDPVALEAFDQCAAQFPEFFDGDTARFDDCFDDRLRPTGFGTVFNGRLALIYTHGPFVFKGIYSEAFKDASNFQRFAREPFAREIRNLSLQPETVDNLELAASWQPSERLSVEVAGYEATYTDSATLEGVVGFVIPSRSARFVNLGRLRIRGLQANATWQGRELELYGNLTYTDAEQEGGFFDLDGPVAPSSGGLPPPEPIEGEIRPVGDIAKHRINLGAHWGFNERLGIHLRGNYVGARMSGPGTSVSTNPIPEFGAYFLAHATVTYRHPTLLPGASLQLVVNNLGDIAYDDPGVQLAGRFFSARLPQPGRTAYLRLRYSY